MGIFGRYLPVVFLISLLFILGDAVFSFTNLTELHDYEVLVNHSRDVLHQIDTVVGQISTMEGSARGYMIFSNPSYKITYASAAASIEPSIKNLRHLTANDTSQTINVNELQSAVKNRQEILQNALTVYNDQGISGVQALPSDAAYIATEQIRVISQRIQLEEKYHLTERSRETDKTYKRIISSITLATILSLLLIILAYSLAVQELRRRKSSEDRKDEFISLASHELKTPITSQKVYIQLLKNAVEKHHDAGLLTLVEKVDNQASRLIKLVTELLDISRIQTGKLTFNKEAIDLNELIKDTVESIQGTTRKHTLLIETRIKRLVIGDRYRLYQVLVNLLTNAIKYSPSGGEIMISAYEVGSSAEIRIADKGIGIAKEHQKKIFERLYQVSDSGGHTYPGLGIGLFISKQIVEQHSGIISVESSKGEGSTFIVTLPLSTELKSLKRKLGQKGQAKPPELSHR